MKTYKLTFHHDDGALDIIDGFQFALAEFGLFIEDVTGPDDETISVRVTDIKPKKEWGDVDNE